MSQISPATQLTCNVRGPEFTIDLAPLTLIAGPNESRKTAALIGYALGWAGRFGGGSTGKAIAGLNDSELTFAKLLGPDWEGHLALGGSLKRPGKPQSTVTGALAAFSDAERQACLPLISLREILDFGEKRGRELLLRTFGSDSSTELIPAGLTPAQTSWWNEALEAIASPIDDPSEILANLGVHFRSEIRKLGLEIKTLEASVGHEREELASLGMVGERLAHFKALRDTALEAQGRQAWTVESTKQLEQARADLARLEGLLPEAKRAVVEAIAARDGFTHTADHPLARRLQDAQLAHRRATEARQEDPQGVRLRRAGALAEVSAALAAVGAGVHNCPLCAAADRDFNEAHKKNAERLALRGQEAADIEARVREARAVAEAAEAAFVQEQRIRKSAVDTQQAALTVLRNKIAEAERQVEGLEALQAAGGEAYEGLSVEEIDGRIEVLEDADRRRTALERDSERLEKMQQKHAGLQTLSKLVPRMAASILEDLKLAAEDAVNKFLPQGSRAELDLTAMKWRVADKGGVLRDAYSGRRAGELAIALMLGYTQHAPVRIVLLDDEDLLHFDESALQALLEGLVERHARGEILQAVAAVKTISPDEFPVPTGWTKVLAPSI